MLVLAVRNGYHCDKFCDNECRFEKAWLKFGYDKQKKIEDNFAAGILSEKMKNALFGVHNCSPGALPTEPSTKDLEFINGVYG